MVKLAPFILIIFSMIGRSLGPRYGDIRWTTALIRQLMDIYYESSPSERGHLERMKQNWDRQLPDYAHLDAYKLRKSAWDMVLRQLKKWQQKSTAEREQIERTFQNIFEETDNGEPNHERRMLDKLLEIHPEYKTEFEMMRTVVYKWWQKQNLHKKELNYDQINWTSELEADLLHIINRVRFIKGDTIKKRIKSRWLRMHDDLNVKASSLLNYAYKLEHFGYEPSAEDKRRAEEKYATLFPGEEDNSIYDTTKRKGKKENWSKQKKADAIYMHTMLQNDKRTLGIKMKAIWDRMYKDESPLSRKDLLSRASRLKKEKYKPSDEHLKRAEEKFKEFAHIAIQGGTQRQLEIREGKKPSHLHQDIPSSSYTPHVNLDLTLGRSSWYPTMDESGPSHTKSDHHPHTDYHNGSSSHNQSDQVPLKLQRDIPNQYRHQSDYGTDSSSSPKDQ